MTYQPKSVLLADEDAFVRDRLRLFLEQDAGMHVCGKADNGLEAVRIAKRCKPDLVIMGLRMPEMNGAETATAIRHALPHTRIVISRPSPIGSVSRWHA